MPAAEGGGGGGATWALLAPWGRDGISSCMPLLLARALSTTPDVKDAGRAGPRGRASGQLAGLRRQVKKLVQRHGHEGLSDPVAAAREPSLTAWAVLLLEAQTKGGQPIRLVAPLPVA